MPRSMTDLMVGSQPQMIDEISCSVKIQLRVNSRLSIQDNETTIERVVTKQEEVEIEDEDFIDTSSDEGINRDQGDDVVCTFAETSVSVQLPTPSLKRDPEFCLNELNALERICTIGTGTFGRVILCKQHSSQYRALKAMLITEVIRTKQVEHVYNERAILEMVDHPFLIKMYWSCHDERHLYMLFDYVPGGELFSYLRAMGYFATSMGRFYAAEIILALEYLHSLQIVYRDLKPENLLLDRQGHLKITDFGFAKKLADRTWTLCGTPEYLAPEIIENKGHNKAVDWWALGVLVFEMLAGYPPFYGKHPLEIYERILNGRMKFPKYFDLIAKDLVRKLLSSDRTKRIGNMKGGAEDVKRHKWFRPIEWEECLQRNLKPPIIPKVAFDGDPGNFDEYEEEPEGSVLPMPSANEQSLFNNW